MHQSYIAMLKLQSVLLCKLCVGKSCKTVECLDLCGGIGALENLSI